MLHQEIHKQLQSRRQAEESERTKAFNGSDANNHEKEEHPDDLKRKIADMKAYFIEFYNGYSQNMSKSEFIISVGLGLAKEFEGLLSNEQILELRDEFLNDVNIEMSEEEKLKQNQNFWEYVLGKNNSPGPQFIQAL